MARTLTVVQPLTPGDHAPALRGDPGMWLPSPRPAGPGAWRIEVRAGGLHRPVRCTVGIPWRTAEGLWRHVRWEPLDTEADALPITRLLPALDAELHLVGPSSAPSLLLDGEVEVPLGWLGEAADAVVLNRVSQATGARFLADIATGLAALAAIPADATTV